MYSYNQTINSEAKIYNHFKIYASIIKLFFPCAKYTQFFFFFATSIHGWHRAPPEEGNEFMER